MLRRLLSTGQRVPLRVIINAGPGTRPSRRLGHRAIASVRGVRRPYVGVSDAKLVHVRSAATDEKATISFERLRANERRRGP